MKVDDLREKARAEGVEATSSMKKEELVAAISDAYRDRGGAGGGVQDGGIGEAGHPGDRGPDEGRLRTGEETSRSLQYSQEVTSLDEDPERAGRSLATTSRHEVIRKWAEDRNGVPATVEGTEHGDHLGVLRFDFGGNSENLRKVSWDEWFETFDAHRLNFIYQEQRKDGNQQLLPSGEPGPRGRLSPGGAGLGLGEAGTTRRRLHRPAPRRPCGQASSPPRRPHPICSVGRPTPASARSWPGMPGTTRRWNT